MQNNKNLVLASVYFLLSTVLTALFIRLNFTLYSSTNQLWLSGIIAGTKWGLQLCAAYLFLGRKKFEFMKRIGWVCLIGSILLIAIHLLATTAIADKSLFIFTLLWSVVVMTMLYYRAVRLTGISKRWFYGWFACLTLAISLQLTVVFHVI